jgi:16S rRNA (cytidine1402-2'-O)-methyltransferase
VASLYVVSTPIGNLGDVTRRAAEVLGSVDVVLAEDTRRTGGLLKHLGVSARMISAHEHNESSRSRLVVEILGEGRDVALVTDAGTPLLSDPGARIVREVVAAGHDVVPVPGASALLAALVGSGIEAGTFSFLGFPPRKGGSRTEMMEEIAASPRAVVLYESPHRVGALLRDLAAAAGGERRACVARELTKLHEEFVRGGAAEVAAHFREEPPRGEIVLVVAPAEAIAEAGVDEAAGDALARALLAEGHSPRDVVRELRRRLGISRNDAYRIALAAETSAGDAEG